MSRYQPRQVGIGLNTKWAVLDTIAGGYLGDFKPGTWSAANVECGRLNREHEARPQKPAAACTGCDRCDRLEAALVAIVGCATEESVRRRAEDALAVIARMEGAT
jgi:hypothetical protein